MYVLEKNSDYSGRFVLNDDVTSEFFENRTILIKKEQI